MRLTQQAVLLLGLLCVKAAPGPSGQAFFRTTAQVEQSSTNNDTQWDLGVGPPSNSSNNLIFSTVSSFLQHWPNTKYRNGHNIVPGIVPAGTLLYHGTYRKQIPNTPEWTATDPEHSYLFCRGFQPDTGCWHLTLSATRSLKVLYFDGSSAAKMKNGPMDSQDLLVWKEVRPDWAFREGERIARLCDWGKKYGIDGFVRMEMDFEVMLCDFHAGVEVVSFLNLVPAAPMRRRPNEANPTPRSMLSDASLSKSKPYGEDLQPPTDGPKGPFSANAIDFRTMEAGSWHNQFPGDPRFRLDYSRIVSFYDPALFPSLQIARQGQGRLNHRLDRISQADVETLFLHFDIALKDWSGVPAGSGVDWQNIIRVITNRYAERLEILHYILNSTSITSDPLKMAYRHLSSMVAPYTLFSAVPPRTNDPDNGNKYDWASEVYELCATTHTKNVENSGLASKLTHSERLLLAAVKGVTKEICRVVVGLWAEGKEAGLGEPDPEGENAASRTPIQQDPTTQVWKARVEELMSWLDWGYWLRCRPACAYEEMCYLPTWPWFLRRPRSIFTRNQLLREASEEDIKQILGEEDVVDDPEPDDWTDPQPRCVRRVEPLEFWDTWGPL